MTNEELITAIRAHKGTVFACINGQGQQYHIPVTKAAAIATFKNEIEHYGKKRDTDLTVDLRDDGLYIDTIDLNEGN